jgi:hypothetical protein
MLKRSNSVVPPIAFEYSEEGEPEQQLPLVKY